MPAGRRRRPRRRAGVAVPGAALFDAARRELGELPLIAEDLGVITRAVRRLRDELGLPGMAVLQFGFDGSARRSPHQPDNHREHSVVYTATHDQDPVARLVGRPGRRRARPRRARAARARHRRARAVVGPDRLALSSPARLAMIQAQDVLGLGSEARMNMPGRGRRQLALAAGAGRADAALARRLRRATAEAGRARMPAARGAAA